MSETNDQVCDGKGFSADLYRTIIAHDGKECPQFVFSGFYSTPKGSSALKKSVRRIISAIEQHHKWAVLWAMWRDSEAGTCTIRIDNVFRSKEELEGTVAGKATFARADEDDDVVIVASEKPVEAN